MMSSSVIPSEFREGILVNNAGVLLPGSFPNQPLEEIDLPLGRASLRLPFYAQCYPVAVFALGLSLGVSLMTLHAPSVVIAGRVLIGAEPYLLYRIGNPLVRGARA
ncbi:hypothetical protein MOK15_19230 [Sphingobium sp. BYY-5]|uniref:hypothetical protein n=1 Tax=Sphingobium sp. BYY-5 TaxID=2926400 RepID=UPI001FA708D8|nr:hypothetical protein [Sphingobium sp. BYY-5]MCI4592216.1 hypothetical protein [Sphingobium sp. BYY-5]